MRTHPLRPDLVLVLACLLAVLLFFAGLAFSHIHFWGRYLLPIVVAFLWGGRLTWRRDIYIVTTLASALVFATFWLSDTQTAADLLVNHLLPIAILWGVAWLLAQRRQLGDKLETQRLELLDQQQKLAAEVATRTAELQASERRYRLLAENAGDLIWTVDMDGSFTYVSPSAQHVRGVTREEEQSASWFDRMPPATAARAAAALQADLAALRAGRPIDGTPRAAPAYRKDGMLMWSETIMTSLYDEAGKPLGLCGVTRDITARHLAETHLHEANQRLELATAAAGIGVWAVNLADDSLEWDERMYELHAVTPEERRAGISYDFWRARIHPDDLALAGPGRENPSRLARQWSGAYRIVLPGGAVRHIQANALVEYDSSGSPHRIIGINRDITDQVAYDQLLRESNAVLEQRVAERTAKLQSALTHLRRAVSDLQVANQLKDEFMAMISHELRTPLTGVLSLSELLADEVGGPLNVRQATYVKGITDSGERLLAVINGILSYTHLLAGKIQLDAAQCELANLLTICATSQQHKAAAKGQAISVEVTPPDLAVTADATALAEVLKHLLDNAIKFTPEGGQIGLEAHAATRNTVAIVVWDTGIGIPADQLDNVFHAFTQADGRLARSHEGLGLGLAYADQMIRLMGGTIGVASTPGAGSCFTISLPALPAAS